MKIISAIGNILQSYNSFVAEDKYADPRTKNYFLVSNPFTVFLIAASYLYFCNKLGPKLMERRKPYKLKTVLLIYNIFQIIISFYLSYKGSIMYYQNYNWFCEPMDFSDTPLNQTVINLAHTYFILKLIEFLDTIFFVLRKKNYQISFLHLFHHTSMFCGCWVGIRYFVTGHGVSFGIINSFIHVIMYSYYLIAGLGPQYQKYLWWKKYLTLLQLIQFCIIFLVNLIPLFSSCTYPKVIHLLLMGFSSTFIYMFGKFYVNTYKKSKQKRN